MEWYDLPNIVMQVTRVSDHVKDARSQLHHTEAMLKAQMARSRIHQIRERKLMDVTETLIRRRIQHLALRRLQADKGMDRIANLESCSHKFTLCLSCIATRIALLPMQRKRICARKVMI